MNTPLTTRICPECGGALAADAPEGLCRACLLKRGLETNTVAGSEIENRESNIGKGWTPPAVGELAGLFPELEVLELIGRGGMGAVYKARQKGLHRLVALKILPPEIGKDAAFKDRFAREAQAMARLNHPHIVAIHDFGQRGGIYFFLMEFVDGLSLRQVLNASKLSPNEALAVVPQICEALQFAHNAGIVHRDIKPENILLDKTGRVKIADFGLAKLVGQSGGPATFHTPITPLENTLTLAGSIMGTPVYMAPEQTEHPDEVDHRADIYSLGVVFYQMLTGELPLGKFAPPSTKVVIDVRLDEVVLRALEKNPDRRYQQATDVKTQVETIASTPAATNVAQPPSAMALRAYSNEYRSKATLFGLPWLHIANGFDARTGKALEARGIVALGGRATGVLAVGGLAKGVIAVGGVAIGGIAMGGVSLGVASFGGLAIALLISYGGLAVAMFAVGGLAVGISAFGGMAITPAGVFREGHNPSPSLMHTAGGFYAVAAGLYAGLTMFAFPMIRFARRRAMQSPKNGSAARALRIWIPLAAATCIIVFLIVAYCDGWLGSPGAAITESSLIGRWDSTNIEFVKRGNNVTTHGTFWFRADHTCSITSESADNDIVEDDGTWDIEGPYLRVTTKSPVVKNGETTTLYRVTVHDDILKIEGDNLIATFQRSNLAAPARVNSQSATNQVHATQTADDVREVEAVATKMLRAIQDGDDRTLAELASNHVRGWPEAIAGAAAEARATYKSRTGKPFEMRISSGSYAGPGNSYDSATLICESPAEFKDTCLIFHFKKIAGDWKNVAMQDATAATIKKQMDDFASSDAVQAPMLARTFVNQLANGDFNEARKTFDVGMQMAMPTEKLAALWKQLEVAGGTYQGVIGDIEIREMGVFTAAYVPTRWEKNGVDLKVVFSKDHKITGLWVVKMGED